MCEPIWFRLIHIVIFEDQMDSVRRASVLDGMNGHIVNLDNFALGQTVTRASDVKGDIIVRDKRDVDFVRPFRRRIFVPVRVNNASRCHPC